MDNPELTLAYNYAQYTRRNIFLTGKAGTGKTTFLRHLVANTHKRIIVLAPTGVAAINAGGNTIHSFFQLAPGLYLPGQEVNQSKRYGFSKHKLNILRSLDLLVIDEISMVRCDLLDAIDEVLRRYQDRNKPFGGVQLLMIGDLQQLAPVAQDKEWDLLREHYATPYFFDSHALQLTDYTIIELKKVYRQQDTDFITLLNQVRDNCLDEKGLSLLNSRYIPGFRPAGDEHYIMLTTHNRQADSINEKRMAELTDKPMTFHAEVEGDFPESSYPTEKDLLLKAGAQVMFCKNDASRAREYYNGLIGQITDISSRGEIRVAVPEENGGRRYIHVGAVVWENIRYDTNARTGQISEKVVGTFTQIPLRAAWAITIHKSQGLTFDHAVINAGRAFSPGQVYVALSRCRTLEGLVLATPIDRSVIWNDSAVTAYNRQAEERHPTVQQLQQDRRKYIEELLCGLFEWQPFLMRLQEVERRCAEKLGRYYPEFIRRMSEIEGQVESRLAKVGHTFQIQIRQMMTLTEVYDDNHALQERIRKGISYFMSNAADILETFFEEGLPEIENQQSAEFISNEYNPLKADYDLRMALYVNCVRQFSLDIYWDTKAKAAMTEDTNARPVRKTKKAGAGNRPAKKESETPAMTIDMNNLNPEVFMRLKVWRTKLAVRNHTKPFMILSNATLAAIASVCPRTPEALAAIPGMGPAKLREYGEEILSLIG